MDLFEYQARDLFEKHDVPVLGGAVAAGGTAFTGSNANVPLWIVLILGLFVAGVLLVMLARRRKRSVGTGS